MNKKTKIYTINLADYSNQQLENFINNINIYLSLGIDKINCSINDIFNLVPPCSYPDWKYSYYFMEGEYKRILCDPIVLLFNFEDLLFSHKYNSFLEIEMAMNRNEILGGDLLTSGVFDFLEVKLLNGQSILYSTKCEHIHE